MAMGPTARQDMLKEVELRVALASLIPTIAIWDAMVPGVPTVAADLHSQFKMSEERWKGYDTERVTAGHNQCIVPTTTGEFAYEKVLHISTAGTDGHLSASPTAPPPRWASDSGGQEGVGGRRRSLPMGFGLEQVFREYDFIPSLRTKIGNSKVPEGCNSILNLLMFGASPS